MTKARGKYAYGFCDRSGFRYDLHDLVYEFRNGVRNGLRVGKDMVDPDHPQNFIGRIKFDDPQSIQDARPDRVEPATEVILDSLKYHFDEDSNEFEHYIGKQLESIRIALG